MRTSDSVKNLLTALVAAQKELKNPHFDSTNPHFKSRFASLAAVRAEVIPAFGRHGLSVSQWPIAANHSAGCLTFIGHTSGEFMEESFLIPVDKPNAHGYASAVTYAKRISMMSVAGIVGDDDDDGNAAAGPIAHAASRPGDGVGKITPASGYWEAMSIDVQNAMLDLAHRVQKLLKAKDIAGAYDELNADTILKHADGFQDVDRWTAFWTRMDSTDRATLKKEGERRRTKSTTDEKAAA